MYERDDAALETAQARKLDFAIDACGLKPGDRVLDGGGGWGNFTEHAGRRGIQITTLTIFHQSEQFLKGLIEGIQLPAQVLNRDFLSYDSPDPFDAIVIRGAMEHPPGYPAALKRLLRLLKPAGRINLDASAFREKHVKPAFVSRYIFPGDHSYFFLHDSLAAAAKTPLGRGAVPALPALSLGYRPSSFQIGAWRPPGGPCATSGGCRTLTRFATERCPEAGG